MNSARKSERCNVDVPTLSTPQLPISSGNLLTLCTSVHLVFCCITLLHCSRLQLDVRDFSLGRPHLVNAYEVKAGISVIAGKTV